MYAIFDKFHLFQIKLHVFLFVFFPGICVGLAVFARHNGRHHETKEYAHHTLLVERHFVIL